MAERAVALRPRARGPGALARRVLTDAGFEPEAFVRDVSELPAAPPAAALGASPLDGGTTAAFDIAEALAALHRARFDEALAHVERARAKLPANPMVLLAAVQVRMLRMRAKGFDAASAADVRHCLVELDRQLPGDERVFTGMPASD